jgi:hypothetical protein
MNQILFGAEVPLGGLNGRVAEEQLNLFKLTSTGAAELRAGTAEIMGAIPGTPAALA